MNEPPNEAKPDAALAASDGARHIAGRSTEPQDALLRPAEVERASLPKIIRFDALARCGEEIWIENEGQIYRLRKTRQGKLILTK